MSAKRLALAFNLVAGVAAVATGIGGIIAAGVTMAGVIYAASGAAWAGASGYELFKNKHADSKKLPKP
jgi:hypothetical protein